MKLIFSIENLDCAHCAAEIERKIQELEEIESASLSFATKQLHIVVSDENGILERIQHAADMVEEGVVFKKADSVSHHDHGTMLRKWDIIILITGISLYVLGLLSDFVWEIELISHIFLYTAYLILGFDIIVASVKNISKGQFFDEKFLMCIATIGALVIGCPEEAVGVMVFFRIGQLFEHIAIDKSRKTIMDAIDFRPETVQLLKDGQIQTIPAADVRIGDILTVRAGDRIPVDGIIHKGTSSVDTSAITGESIPLEVCAKDAVMSGCINLSGVLELEATATLKNSMVTRILESVENAAAGKPKIDRFITRFSKVYTPSVVVIAILTAIVPSIITGNAKHWIYTALNFLMISCPCALVLSVPLAYFCGIGVGSRRGILFKDGISLEILADIKAVVMDKTGTLT
ncbi:MAG: heavy metal translocating P-type ATPase, partial [Oscillospiraceae bacterium]|nr:heavy metal translocating P-type ATPase [Oscillospiraceae bacterium]